MNYRELEIKQEKEELLFYHDFWKHYIALEKLFMETEKYVAISEDNKKTYSIQYDILLQAICGEIDVVIKRLCYELDYNSQVHDMYDYIRVLLKNDKYIQEREAKLELYNMKFIPWKNIGFMVQNGHKKPICPKWWNVYIGVKHNRITFEKQDNEFKIKDRNIKQANQDNVLNALAGLFIIEMRCLDLMRNRFYILFKDLGSESTIVVSNRFNDSIFQETIEITECF